MTNVSAISFFRDASLNDGGTGIDHGEAGDDPACAYTHDGPCPQWGRTAVLAASSADGFSYDVRPNGTEDGHTLHGYVNGQHAGSLEHTLHGGGAGVYVDDLHTNEAHQGNGVASSMMNALHSHYPNAWINHGTRTPDGTRWWNRYSDPAPHRNIHNVAPDDHSHGMPDHWTKLWSPFEVTNDVKANRDLHIDLGLNSQRARQINRVTRLAAASQSFARGDGEDWSDHQSRVRRGLSLGHLDYMQAREHGYTGDAREDTRDDWTGQHKPGKGWQPLPPKIYHTTTDAAGVAANGLKSGEELGQRNGHGLGGTPQWLSMTHHETNAHNMLDALHEYHDHLNGKTTYTDLHRAAQQGHGAEKPFHEDFENAATGGHNEHAKESMRRGKRLEPGFATYDEAAERGWSPHPTLHKDFGEDKHGRRIGTGWERDPNVEERHDEYGAFSRSREWGGQGKPSVLFTGNDRAAFAKKDPSNFAVLHLRPRPGAQGFPGGDKHEWRTGTGDAVEVHGEPIRRQAAALKSCPCCDGLGEHGTGFECYHCDAGMTVPADSPDHVTCDGTLPDGGHGKTVVPDNHEPYQHEHDWLPHDHFFAPGEKGLDPRLFDGDRMHPIVRQHLLSLLNSFWAPKYGDSWQSWARVYLAGSEASHWYGNGDLDVLIGIDYERARHFVDAFTGEPDGALDTKLTDELREHLNDDARMLPGPDGHETGPWESTWYVNPGSYDIRVIKPYAAYDITRDEWAVKPVEVPADFGPEKLPESTWDVLDAVQKLITAIRELPEGVREREGSALYDYLHADRHSAFGPDGTGLYDPANAVWKALDKAPGKPLQQLIDWKHAHDGVAAATDQENAA